MIHYFKDRLRNAHNALFDGFPRTEDQAKAFESSGIRFNHVIYLEVPEGIAEQRCLTRRVCSDLDCSRIYGESPSIRTTTPNQCDRCLGTLYQREDDKSLTKIRKRMDEFRTKTAKLLPLYRRKELLFKINADQPAEAVYQDVLKALRT
jgi:adenylate kinase